MVNWIERLYEIKGKDLYSQNGEGLLLEYIVNYFEAIHFRYQLKIDCYDIGGVDGFYLSNVRQLKHVGANVYVFDSEFGVKVDLDNVCNLIFPEPIVLSVDTDGNDFWLLDKLMPQRMPWIICAEFNPAFTDSRTIKYNPSHEWAGDDYFGFSFEAGKKLAEKHGYEIIFNVANMNLIMVRKDLIKVTVPPVTYKQDIFFKASNRPESDWVFI